MNEVMISIVRPLDAHAIIEPGWTRKDLCLSYCRNDVENTEQFLDVYTLREYSCATLCGIYNAILILAYHLDDQTTHDLFTRSCRIIRLTAGDYPMARFILQGIKAVTWDQGVPIPPAAQEYFEDLGSSKETLRDVPMGLALPESGNVRRHLADAGDTESSEKIATDMGTLLAKWSAMAG